MSDDEDVIKIPVELQEDGLLWLINRTVFHPRGFALAMSVEIRNDVSTTVFELWGNGDEPWRFEKIDETKLFRAAEAVLTRARKKIT